MAHSKSKLLSSKITLNKVSVIPLDLHALYTTTKSDDKKIKVFERRILKNIYVPKENTVEKMK